MTHYTCPECGGQSDTPKVCETENCLRRGQDLISCECTDGEHGADNDEDYYSR